MTRQGYPDGLEGPSLLYKREMLFPDKMLLVTEEESGNMLVMDAKMYKFLGPHLRLVVCYGLETTDGKGWTIRLQRIKPG